MLRCRTVPLLGYNNQQRLKLRILIVSWNMASRLQPIQQVAKLLSADRLREHDIVIVGTQECEDLQIVAFFKNSKHGWESLLNSHMLNRFCFLGKEAFHGTHIIAYARPELMPYISLPQRGHTYAGFKGVTGSKAAVGLFFTIGLKSFNFINCHLKADQSKTAQRNEGLYRVLRRLQEHQNADESYLFGDLNYRIEMSKLQALFFNEDISTDLQKRDQLYLEQALGRFLSVYQQGPLTFGPTYKLSKRDYRYKNDRIPGWTDRIFYRSKLNEASLRWYTADFTVLGSDHRPVLASFQSSFPSIR